MRSSCLYTVTVGCRTGSFKKWLWRSCLSPFVPLYRTHWSHSLVICSRLWFITGIRNTRNVCFNVSGHYIVPRKTVWSVLVTLCGRTKCDTMENYLNVCFSACAGPIHCVLNNKLKEGSKCTKPVMLAYTSRYFDLTARINVPSIFVEPWRIFTKGYLCPIHLVTVRYCREGMKCIGETRNLA